ncbi:putative membrane protein DUF2142 [Actinomadura pelletieri DSM 43383]|uniref:Putative membrane protein DUF2142 n=1 Tax=Actinomadura pelletieri DSM 43383 TaxID=1120940 RepID=A0A495QGW4_9ACTN|nr:DUF2142 domain-containing protein [Actinomadura pelletieri]RKS71146.1 putative membrane protein DUF2142 [Actinomadura pelletieri DSM 43383]
MSTRRLRSIVALAFLGFFAVGAGWAIALPWDGGPDEQSHITRAAGVVGGDIAAPPVRLPVPGLPRPLPGTHQTVPGGVAHPSPPCFAWKPRQPANCVRVPAKPKHEPVEQFTAGAGRYQPTYYAVVGWPLRWWPGEGGLLVARLVSAALSAAFLAAAVYSVLAWSRRPFLLAGLLVATTPMAMHLAGVINANGLEVTAAIAMWTALIPLVLDKAPPDRRQLILVGVSAVTVAWSRPDGPMTVALALVILVGTAGRARLAALVRNRGSWITGTVVTLACLGSAIWTLAMKATELVPVPVGAGLGPAEALRLVVVERTSFYLKSMVGLFGWVDVEMPDAFYAIWFAATGFLVIAALASGSRTDRCRLALVVAGAFALPLWMDVMGAEKDGMMAQGRYILPTAVGAAVLAAHVIDERQLLDPRFVRSVTRWLAVAILPAHLIALAYAMIRYQHGLYGKVPAVNPLTGDWTPPLGPATALGAAVAGLAALGAMTWLATTPTVETEPHREAAGDDGLRLDRGDASGHLGDLPRPRSRFGRRRESA